MFFYFHVGKYPISFDIDYYAYPTNHKGRDKYTKTYCGDHPDIKQLIIKDLEEIGMIDIIDSVEYVYPVRRFCFNFVAS